MAPAPTHAHMIPGNRVALLHDGAACLPAMLAAIDGAKEEILLEMYWFGSDTTGRKFAAALIEKAKQGVRVHVTYDSVGSWESDPAMFEDLRRAGCDVNEYNRVRWYWPKFRLSNRRNHRKILVVDGRIGMTGGVNLGDPWAAEADGGKGFRDDLICIEGPAVVQLRDMCIAMLRERRGPPRSFPTLPVPEACGDVKLRVLTNRPRRNRRIIVRAYLDAIERAQRRVTIENSYFIPDFFVRRVLARAVRRGANVRVVLPYESDVPIVAYATRKLYSNLLRRGLRIFEWSRGYLHSKIAVVDDWCTVGTHNLDYRSWFFNLEVNVIVEDAAVAQALATRIERDISQAVEIEASTWKYRPLQSRFLEEISYRFRHVL